MRDAGRVDWESLVAYYGACHNNLVPVRVGIASNGGACFDVAVVGCTFLVPRVNSDFDIKFY